MNLIRTAPFLALVSIVALTGCGGGGGQPPSTASTRTISGEMNLTNFLDFTTQQLPADTTKLPIAALVPDGSGGYRTMNATGSSSGQFTITDVPAGPYLLALGNETFVALSTSAPDAGFAHLGRLDAQRPTLPTQVTLSITNLSPLQPQDAIQVYVANTGAYQMWHGADLAGLPAGATTFTRALPWTDYLSDASKNDTAAVFQMSAQRIAGYWIQRMTKGALVTFSQTDGSTTPVSLNLSDVSVPVAVHLDYRGSQFATLESGLNPHATEDSTFLYVDAAPYPINTGKIGATPDLVTYLNTDGPISTDVDFGAISFFNSYYNRDLFFDAQQQVRMAYVVPGASTPYMAYGQIRVLVVTPSPATAAPIQPIVGPATNPTINNKSFFETQSSVGLTPTIAWHPPQLGTATQYQLKIVRLYADSQGTPQAQEIAALLTTSTSLRLPPNLLVSGNSYAMSLTAIADPNVDASTAPSRQSVPRGSACAISGLITP